MNKKLNESIVSVYTIQFFFLFDDAINLSLARCVRGDDSVYSGNKFYANSIGTYQQTRATLYDVAAREYDY